MRKGQYTLIEQVFLFAIGISITLGFMFAFEDLKATVKEDVKDGQSELVAEYVVSTAVELAASRVDGRMDAPLPERIASEAYVVRMGDGGVKVQTAGAEEVAPLYGLTAVMEPGGAAESRQGAVSVTRSGDDIRIDEVE